MGPAGEREKEILTAVVETFIATGEPVGSRTLSRGNREGLSAATIRNVMADLSDAGFLEQPHTSAGRIPTPEAYRYYVEQLTGQARLAPEHEATIQSSLSGVTDVQEFMERTSHVLSLLSHNVGVTVATSGPRNALEHVYFSRLGDQKVLAVLVTRSGVVRDRVLRLDLSQADLDLASRYINENFRGWTMEQLRQEIAHRIEQERSEYDRLMKSIEQLYQQGALSTADSTEAVYVEGAANLVSGEQDRQRLQDMITKAHDLLCSNFALLEEERRRFRFVLVDEFQDANYAQIRILAALAGEKANVFAVGDPDQAIYRFRGASSAAFALFHRMFPATRLVVLDKNRRSRTPILKCAFSVISKNPGVFTGHAQNLAYKRSALVSVRDEAAAGSGSALVHTPVQLATWNEKELEAADLINELRNKRRQLRLPWRPVARSARPAAQVFSQL